MKKQTASFRNSLFLTIHKPHSNSLFVFSMAFIAFEAFIAVIPVLLIHFHISIAPSILRLDILFYLLISLAGDIFLQISSISFGIFHFMLFEKVVGIISAVILKRNFIAAIQIITFVFYGQIISVNPSVIMKVNKIWLMHIIVHLHIRQIIISHIGVSYRTPGGWSTNIYIDGNLTLSKTCNQYRQTNHQ